MVEITIFFQEECKPGLQVKSKAIRSQEVHFISLSFCKDVLIKGIVHPKVNVFC